jgi:prepilin-type N-terminal cleavage/methylation domain-containing protein
MDKFITHEKRGSQKSGFTLVELLITICVLAFGCLAAIQMQSASMRGTNFSDNLTAAIFLAESELERLKALSFTKLEEEGEVGTIVQPDLNRLGEICPTAPVSCSQYPFTRTVNYFPSTPTSFSYQVEVEVTWRDNSGPHSVYYSGAVTSYVFI